MTEGEIQRDEVPAGEAPREPTARDRLLYAVLFAVIEDGLVAVSTSMRAHAGPVMSLLAGLESSAFMIFPLALAAFPVAWLLDRPSAAAFGRQFRLGLAAGDERNQSAGVMLFALVLAAGAAITYPLGMRIAELQSSRVSILATLAVALLVTAGAPLVSTLLVGPVGKVTARFGSKVRIPEWLPAPSFFVAVLGVVGMYLFLPPSHAITPAAALVGFVTGPEIGARIGSVPFRRRLPTALLLAIALALTTISSFALKRLPDAAQLGILARAPYGSIMITSIRRLFDRDGDGYSAILGGGDCDDRDAAIHPNAVDVPNNGVDENCSGADAHEYKAMPQPPVSEPPIPNAPQNFNVVLVHLEAVRPDHLGMNGYGRPTSPRLDRFKNGAVWFRNAYTPAPSTRFAASAIFTGLEIARIPQRRGTGVDFWLLPEATTLAERLEPLGYDRVGYTLSYVVQHIHDLGQGFRTWEPPWRVDDWKATYPTSAALTTDAGIKYLKTMPADGSKPYFLFLHYGATHDPYIKHDQWNYGDEPIDLWDSALNYEDDQLGRLFDAIDARTDKDRTVVVVYSDHGELFGEHGLTKHGNSLFQPDVRVLLLVRVPGITPRPITAPVTLTDLSPTLLHLTGLPQDTNSQAWDLVPYMRGAPLPARPLYFYGDLWRSGVHYEERALLAPDGRTKFIHDISNNMNILVDLARDPDELTNIADAQPVVASQMSEDIDSWDGFESAGMNWEDTHKAKRAAGDDKVEDKSNAD